MHITYLNCVLNDKIVVMGKIDLYRDRISVFYCVGTQITLRTAVNAFVLYTRVHGSWGKL